MLVKSSKSIGFFLPFHRYSMPSSTILGRPWPYPSLLNLNPAAQSLPCFCCFANQNMFGGCSFSLYFFSRHPWWPTFDCIQIIRCSSRSCVLALLYWRPISRRRRIVTPYIQANSILYVYVYLPKSLNTPEYPRCSSQRFSPLFQLQKYNSCCDLHTARPKKKTPVRSIAIVAIK